MQDRLVMKATTEKMTKSARATTNDKTVAEDERGGPQQGGGYAPI
jgi:hypothetical protein